MVLQQLGVLSRHLVRADGVARGWCSGISVSPEPRLATVGQKCEVAWHTKAHDIRDFLGGMAMRVLQQLRVLSVATLIIVCNVNAKLEYYLQIVTRRYGCAATKTTQIRYSGGGDSEVDW